MAGSGSDDTDIAACLRVLARAKDTDPGDPDWAVVHEAAAQVYRAGKKSRKAARNADRQLRTGTCIRCITCSARAAVPDAATWLDRLHVHGTDLLDLPAVASLLDTVHDRFPSLDILINNAAQTVRRPAAY